ncbi:MAG: type II CAAX endopeptidase family protein [Anaerolineales bacterium]
MQRIFDGVKRVFAVRWEPDWDLAVVGVSWLLVVAALYTATVVVGPEVGGGMPYFGLYAVLGATVFGVGIPLYWMVVVRKRPLSDLGITTRWLGVSIGLQFVFGALQYFGTLANAQLPAFENLVPLIALSLAIGLFEAIFWRGWVLLRLEQSFGVIPAILVGSALYAAYHIGYAMPMEEITFLFFIGVMFAVVFRLTKNIFILWPFFQPMGQLATLVNDQLSLPLISTLGFVDVLVAIFVLIWLAGRYYNKHHETQVAAASPIGREGHGEALPTNS